MPYNVLIFQPENRGEKDDEFERKIDRKSRVSPENGEPQSPARRTDCRSPRWQFKTSPIFVILVSKECSKLNSWFFQSAKTLLFSNPIAENDRMSRKENEREKTVTLLKMESYRALLEGGTPDLLGEFKTSPIFVTRALRSRCELYDDVILTTMI